MKIAVYVGSFNPVHKGHIDIVNYLINNNIVDKVLIVPTSDYWNKRNIELKHRIQMLEKYASNKIIIEKELNNIEYTYQLLKEIEKKYNNRKLSLVIGADNIVDFNKWKNYKKLLDYELIIFNRNNIDVKSYLDKLGKKDRYIIFDDVNSYEISSTKIRKMLEKYYTILEMIDKDTLKYIIENELYR